MNSNNNNIFLPVFVTSLMSLGIFLGFFFLREEGKTSMTEDRIKEILSIVEENYVDQVDPNTLVENAVLGISKGLPECVVVEKKMLSLSERMKSYGIVALPISSYYLVVNIFPGSLPAILGISAGDRIREVGFSDKALSFQFFNGFEGGFEEISIPDSLAIFQEPILKYPLPGGSFYAIFLSPSLGQIQEYFSDLEVENNAHWTFDFRYFSNIGGYSDINQFSNYIVDSIVPGPNTFGLGVLFEKHFSGALQSKPWDIETNNFIILNSGGAKFPDIQNRQSNPLKIGNVDKVNGIFYSGMFLKQVLKHPENKMKLDEDPFVIPHEKDQIEFYRQIKLNGLKEAYKSLL